MRIRWFDGTEGAGGGGGGGVEGGKGGRLEKEEAIDARSGGCYAVARLRSADRPNSWSISWPSRMDLLGPRLLIITE